MDQTDVAMSDKLPSFERPPVIEEVLGVQFAPLKAFTAAHFGWYWRNCLGEEWPRFEDAQRLGDQVEKFGGTRSWGIPQLQFQLQAAPSADRIQFSSANKQRMIQLQDTRFIYNWISHGSEYPRYPSIRGEFDKRFQDFLSFCERAKLGEVQANQWEVTYVNHIPSGVLWEKPSEWHQVVPGLLKPPSQLTETRFESLSGEWRSIIGDNLGRLHVTLQSRELKKPGTDEASRPTLILHLTARGPVDTAHSLSDGLDLGRKTIVRFFSEVTSPEAHQYWGKE